MKRTLNDFAVAMNGALVGDDALFGAVSIDSRSCSKGELFIALSGENFDGHDYVSAAVERGAVGVVVQRLTNVSVPQILVSDTLQALQQAGAAWRQLFAIPVVGVAGSNGKTTTKEMIASVLSALGPCLATKGTLNNHIGVPLTLLSIDSEHATAVIEIGANHPGEVASLVALVQPTVGVVTNAGAEHLEGFGSLAGAAHAEGELYAGMAAAAIAVMNFDDEFLHLWQKMNRADTVIGFGSHPSADCRPVSAIKAQGAAGERQSFTLQTPAGQVLVQLSLAGRHNVQNALAAAAVAHAVGVTPERISAGLAAMRAVKGRLEVKRAAAGGYVIDDSYNANPSSLEAGLQVLAGAAGKRWVVLGNMAELGAAAVEAHRDAGRSAKKAGATRLFAIGDLAAEAAATFGEGSEVFFDCASLVDRVRSHVCADVTVLVKGSRVNRLERVVEALVTELTPGV